MVIACVLRSGGDFGPEHVQWLAKQVPGVVCLSDVAVPGVETIPLRTDWPGWWSKMEMFGPSLEGDVLMMDLDVVVLSLPDIPKGTTVLRDWLEPSVMNSSLMFVTERDRAKVWAAFNADPAGHMARYTRWPSLGDQAFLQTVIGSAQKWDDSIRSYKVHCRKGLPVGAKVVCFHGDPRPWQIKKDWIPTMTDSTQGLFADLALKHKGKIICVIGGAPITELPKADVYISTNAHGVDLVTPDYFLAMDEHNSREDCEMGGYLRSKGDAPIISPHKYADYRLNAWPQAPRFVLSGLIGAWMAWFMGAKVVVLAGMDGDSGDPGYIDEATKMARDIYGPVRIAGGGPMTAIWPEYDAAERFGKYKQHTAIDKWLGNDGAITIRARKRCDGLSLDVGETMKVFRHEVEILLKHRMVEEI